MKENDVSFERLLAIRCTTVDWRNWPVESEQYSSKGMETSAEKNFGRESGQIQEGRRLPDSMGGDVLLSIAGSYIHSFILSFDFFQDEAKKLFSNFPNAPPFQNEPKTRALKTLDEKFRLTLQAFSSAPHESFTFSFLQIDGGSTYGQWLIRTAIEPGTRLHVSNVTGYSLQETEMLMYFGSSLHHWDSMTVHEFLENDFGLTELVFISMQRQAYLFILSFT